MALTKIALIGANGNLGPSILHALLSSTTPKFNVTVLNRQSSKSTYPSTVTTKLIPDDPSIDDYTSALTSQDVLITTFGGTNSELQIKLADACVAAGVQRFIPADFGSCDSSSQLALELMPLYRRKQEVREHLRQLAGEEKLSWTSLVTGHFFDYGLKSGLLLFDVKGKKATVFDGGEIRWSASTLARVGEAVVAVLKMDGEETRDRMLYVQSFCVTQNELVRACERVSGEKWTVEDVKSEDFIKEMKARTDKDTGDHDAYENLVGVVGTIDADWTGKETFSNGLLGLKDEDLEEAVKKVLEGKKA